MKPDKALFAAYAALKRKEAALKAEIEEMKPRVIESIAASGAEVVETGDGTFTLTATARWTFSPVVETAEMALDVLKKEEIANGLAESKETVSVTFRPKKDA